MTERENLMLRARDLERNNAIAKGMLDRVVDNVVGTGITPQAHSGDEEWDQEAEEYLGDWGENCDVSGRLNFTQVQGLTVRSFLRDGDIGHVLAGKLLQLTEADRVQSPYDFPETENLECVQGVERTPEGRVLAYWVAHDSALFRLGMERKDMTRVEARNFIHVLDPLRASQTRGGSAFGPCLSYFDDLDQYLEAELMGARVSACLTAIMRGDTRTNPLEVRGDEEKDAEDNDNLVVPLEPGMILNMTGIGSGDMEVINPNRPASQFADFMTAILRILGLPLGLPVELICLDYKGGNYGNSRLALLAAYRRFRSIIRQLEFQFLRRVYRWKISQFIKYDGLRLPRPKWATSDRDRMWAAWRHSWHGQRWEWIDPKAEAAAWALGFDRGMLTLEDWAQEMGLDGKEIIARRVKEMAYAQELAQKNGLGGWRDVLRAESVKGGAPEAGSAPEQADESDESDQSDKEEEAGDAEAE